MSPCAAQKLLTYLALAFATLASCADSLHLPDELIDLDDSIDGKMAADNYRTRGGIAPVLGRSSLSFSSEYSRRRLGRKSHSRHYLVSSIKAECRKVLDSSKYCPYVSGYEGDLKSSKSSKGVISPWVLSNDVDVDREPERLYQACCACSHCVNVTGEVPTPMADHYSVPVVASISVFKEINGERRRIPFKLFAGCTCTYRPRI